MYRAFFVGMCIQDSDLTWVNGKSAKTKLMLCWRFQALYNIGSHLPFLPS